jgi:hypothetical protein
MSTSCRIRNLRDLKEWKKQRKVNVADYIRTDPEVDDLVEFLNNAVVVAGAGQVDLDDDEPVYIGVVVDSYSGDRPKASMAISQQTHETRNSILNRADDLMRSWYLTHNHEFVKSIAESTGEEYDAGWEGHVWHLPAAALDEVLQRVDENSFDQILVDRD